MAAPAGAHYVYEKGDLYDSGGHICTSGYAESSHGETGNGYMKGYVEAWRDFTDTALNPPSYYSCTAHDEPDGHWYRPSTNLAVRDYYFRLNPNSGDKSFPKNWSLCEYSDWFYNQKTTWKLSIAGEMRGPTICGNGYYATLSYDYQNNGGWVGGSIFSGGHFLPASPSLSASTQTQTDSNVVYDSADATLAGATDGAIGADGLINPLVGAVTIAGPDGNPIINPVDGQPITVNMAALGTPPTNVAANTVSTVTDLAGNVVCVSSAAAASTSTSVAPAGDCLALQPTQDTAGIGEEFYVVGTHVAAESVLGAP